jgi:methylmalonyl-CoA mutase N-terminal domain/subunit
MSTESRRTSSGIEIEVLYGPERPVDPERIGGPGEYPFTRGPYPSMYRGRPWTMRQYAGFGTAAATNERFKALLVAGQTGLSVAFDLPTQMGYDSDHPMAAGEVGKVGVAIDTLDDLRVLFDELPLDRVSTSMTINSTAAILLVGYQLVAGERGIDSSSLRGTIQNDILKEYIARGTYIFPPRPSMRVITDLFAYCADEIPGWNTISISGYHIREAGSTAAQELAFTLTNGIAYVEAAIEAGLDVDDFAPRLSFFWNSHNDFFEEVAKYRAARRIWAALMRDRIGARSPDAWRMRFHAQTAGSTLTAQQPLNNVVRTTVQAMAAVLGGTQSLHTNAFDEALGLPTEASATVALRTQQILANESGITNTVDPLAGSYFVETLTDELEAAAWELIDVIDGVGGAVAAVEQGVQTTYIEQAAYEAARRLEAGDDLVVGVNVFQAGETAEFESQPVDPLLESDQKTALREHRLRRADEVVQARLADLVAVASGPTNVVPAIRDAFGAGATLGEISDALRSVFGVFGE